jgi:hypothetical protein
VHCSVVGCWCPSQVARLVHTNDDPSFPLNPGSVILKEWSETNGFETNEQVRELLESERARSDVVAKDNQDNQSRMGGIKGMTIDVSYLAR